MAETKRPGRTDPGSGERGSPQSGNTLPGRPNTAGEKEMTSQSIIGPQATIEAPVDAQAPNVERRGPPVPTVSGEDNEGTMAWVQQSLKRARHLKQTRLTGLLEAVQAEVAFELELLEARGGSRVGLAQSSPVLHRR